MTHGSTFFGARLHCNSQTDRNSGEISAPTQQNHPKNEQQYRQHTRFKTGTKKNKTITTFFLIEEKQSHRQNKKKKKVILCQTHT